MTSQFYSYPLLPITVRSLECHGVLNHRQLDGLTPCLFQQQINKAPKPAYWLFVQYIPRNMHAVTALLCFVVVIHWLIFPYPSGLLHWHCGNLTIAPVPAKQPWWIWINTLCEFIMNDWITTTKQSTTKPCAYFLGYTVRGVSLESISMWCLFRLTTKTSKVCVTDTNREGNPPVTEQ